ncbi:MAG: TRAM domain-containing protein [Acidimicrobiia bacterium]|nr:TRAM domain-containing protein [Acidimicrobiia bacterium]
MAVHHVELDAVDAGGAELLAGFSEAGEVGGQDRRHDERGPHGPDATGAARPRPVASGVVEVVELAVTGLAVGGDGVGRDPSGRVVFVRGAVPGDRVRARVTEARRRHARAELIAVTEAAPTRRAPPCPEVARGCGGCSLQHLVLDEQRRLKRQLVLDALTRIGGLDEPDVRLGPALAAHGFRTTLRLAVRDGRAAFRRARRRSTVAVAGCWVAHPLLAELVEEGQFGAATEVTLRAGAATGERIAVVRPDTSGVRVPADVAVVGARAAGGRAAAYHEVVAGRRLRVSAGSFFQSRLDGAELLVERVGAAVADLAPRAAHLVDAYGGVGLLSAAGGAGRVTLVEAAACAAEDARHNLADLDATVAAVPVERWRPEPADVVVADPARHGLGAKAADVLAASSAAVLVLVSCDAGSLGRDAGELARRGFRLERSEVLDLFPHTAHVEVVSRFTRG